jgi:1-acyl-sn-glycerol-3-phosphate acyltransferase
VSDDPAPIAEPIESSITPLISALTLGGRIFGRAMSRITVEGAIDEIPRDGPLILAANHVSNLDAVVLGSWLMPKLGRRIHWLGKKELFDWPIVGWTAAHGGVHPVDRGATRATSCSSSLKARAAPTARSTRRVMAWPCSPCAPARRSSRSGSPARTACGRGGRRFRIPAAT